MAVAEGRRGVSVGGEAVAVGGSRLSVAARAIRVVVAGTDAVLGSEVVQPVVKSAMSRISASTLMHAGIFVASSSSQTTRCNAKCSGLAVLRPTTSAGEVWHSGEEKQAGQASVSRVSGAVAENE
jgi:hypothetical protein